MEAGAAFDLCVVANCDGADAAPVPPERHGGIEMLARENTGFNVGAWQHAWQQRPGYAFYLFLQDECTIRRPGWLRAFLRAGRDARVGLIGESLDPFASWEAFGRFFPDVLRDCRSLASARRIEMGSLADHLQTLAVGARAEVLESMNGFVLGGSKAEAVAGEVLTSALARSRGYRVRQLSWRPFEFVAHPQWTELRAISRSWTWSISRAMHLYLPRVLNARVPRRRGRFEERGQSPGQAREP